MKRLYTGLSLWNAALLAAFFALVLVQQGRAAIEGRTFTLIALFSAFFCCLIHSLLVIHFIGSMKWIAQSAPAAGLSEAESLALRRAWIRGPLFPLLVVGMLLAVATAIVAGGADRVGAPPGVVVPLALVSALVNTALIPFARTGSEANTQRLAAVRDRMATAASPSETARTDPVLLRQAHVAGRKVFLFLAANVWLFYAYNRFVRREASEPLLPYLIASLSLAILGVCMFRSAPHPPPSPHDALRQAPR